MAQKKQYTFSFNEEVRKDFKVETTINGVEMSETIEAFMKNYTATSKRLRLERQLKEIDNG